MGWWLLSNQLRIESDGVATNWESNAQKKKAAMQAEYNSLEDWKKSNVKQYFESNFNYLDSGKTWDLPSSGGMKTCQAVTLLDGMFQGN